MNDLIELSVVVGIRTLLAEGDYQVGDFTINVSYNYSIPHFNIQNVSFDKRRETSIVVKWNDKEERGRLGRTLFVKPNMTMLLGTLIIKK